MERFPNLSDIGWLPWLTLIVLVWALLGCASPPRCSVQGEQLQVVGETSAGDVVQIRSFVELCKAAI